MIEEKTHSPGAIRAAEIITGDNYDKPKGKYDTLAGRKTVIGIADIIDTETGAAELLAACRDMLAMAYAKHGKCLSFEPEHCEICRAKAAIAKAEGVGR